MRLLNLAAVVQSCLDRIHLLDFLALPLRDVVTKIHQFLILETGLAAHQDRAGVVRDHRSDELPIADKSLGARSGECENEEQDQADVKRSVQTFVVVHPAHGREHDDPHGSDHRQRHIERVDVVLEIRESVNHREHDEVHDDEAERHVDREQEVVMRKRQADPVWRKG